MPSETLKWMLRMSNMVRHSATHPQHASGGPVRCRLGWHADSHPDPGRPLPRGRHHEEFAMTQSCAPARSSGLRRLGAIGETLRTKAPQSVTSRGPNQKGDQMSFVPGSRDSAAAAGLAKRTVAVIAIGVLVAVLLAPGASARPFRSHVPWSVLLCKFSDQAVEQQPPGYFTRFLTEAGATQGGVAQYWRDVSSGGIDLEGSVVRGWYTMGVTLAQSQAQGKTRDSRITDCVNAASRGGYSVPSGNRVVAVINGVVDSGSAGGRVLLDPLAWNNAFAAHEMGHGINLDHSFSNDPTYRNVSWAQIGEYDNPWDLMSAMNVSTARSGPSILIPRA
jgi:hypothetical protein